MYVVQRDRLQLSHFFLQQSFIILLSLLSPIPCNPYKQEVREVVAAHYFMYKNAYCHHFIHLVTWYKPTLFVHQTGQACAMNTIGLYGEHGKLVQPRNNDFPCQSIQNLDTSSVGSCSKFHEILYQVLPLHPASIIRKSKFPQNPKRSVRFSGKRTKRSVQKRKARNTQKAETKVL